jgi:carbon storage regulator
MLVLTRRTGEEVVIGEDIRVTVLAVRGGRIRLGIAAPPGVLIRRAEVVAPDLQPPCERVRVSGPAAPAG